MTTNCKTLPHNTTTAVAELPSSDLATCPKPILIHQPPMRQVTTGWAEGLLTARQVTDRLGVSERWVRDHTTRRNPRIRAMKLGSLTRYRWEDVEAFLKDAETFSTSRRKSFGV